MIECADHIQKGAYAAAARIFIKSCYTTPQRRRGIVPVLFLLRRKSRSPSPTSGNWSCVTTSTRSRIATLAQKLVLWPGGIQTVMIQIMARRNEDFLSGCELFYRIEFCQIYSYLCCPGIRCCSLRTIKLTTEKDRRSCVSRIHFFAGVGDPGCSPDSSNIVVPTVFGPKSLSSTTVCFLKLSNPQYRCCSCSLFSVSGPTRISRY